MENVHLLDLLDELEFRALPYTITNGRFEITLGKTKYGFQITDEKETIEMIDIIWNW